MFGFESQTYPVRADIVARVVDAWDGFATAGSWFPAAERTRLAELARSARVGQKVEASDPAAAVASRIAADPATTSEAWVAEMVTELGGEEQYVEVMGIAARVVMVDTFARLLGIDPPPFAEPRPGEPARKPVDPRPKRVRSWIAVGSALVPPFTQALVPDENALTYPLIESLYMTGEDMEDPDYRRGRLHRTQIELVASALSFGNECFY